jgi:long-chain-fatty-acyl-CoA reductase
MEKEIVKIPILINGRVVETDEADYLLTLNYETGISLQMPKITEDFKRELIEKDRNIMVNTHFDDITIFLEEVGKRWSDMKYNYHQRAVELASKVTGYSPNIMEEDYQRIGRALNRQKLYDLVDGDLGSSLLLDDWLPMQSIFLKAQPKGNILHLMVGNVPLAGLFTIVRSVLCKNSTIAKLPSRDPISCLFFALTFADVDPNHAITKSLSVLYWPGGSELETEMIHSSDLVCAWGQGSSIESAKKRVPAGVDFMEFGPKESWLMVDTSSGDLDDICMRAAYDISVYEQEACFSPQRIFVEGDAERFAECLAKWMENIQKRLPIGFMNDDKRAHINRTRLDAAFEGYKIFKSDELKWTVILTDTNTFISEHPLSRTIFIHPVKKLEDAIQYVHREIQTIGISPWERGKELADELTKKGACRITEVGLVSRPRPGFTHDAYQPMRHMVRWVSLERGLSYKGKHRSSSKEEFSNSIYKKNLF